MRLIVVEGPAGTGKTTLITQVEEKGWALRPSRFVTFDRPREYTGLDGISLAYLRDISTTFGMFLNKHHGQCTTIADRWLMSQYVYESIRQRGGETSYTLARTLISTAVNNLQQLWREWRFRGAADTAHDLHLRIHFLVMIPTLEQLLLTRSSAKREFPYDPQLEITTFTHAARAFQNALLTQYSKDVTVELFKISSMNDYELPLKRVERLAHDDR
jgi:hypothetical protein